MKKLYFITLYIFSITTTAIVFSWGSKHIISNGNKLPNFAKEIIIFTSNLPSQIKPALMDLLQFSRLVVDKPKLSKYWNESFPYPSSKDYLLLSAYEEKFNEANARLIRISDGKILHRWRPDFSAIRKIQKDNSAKILSSPLYSGLVHPLLMQDGSIITHMDGVAMRINIKNEIEWANFLRLHHSLEIDSDGNIWGSSICNNFFENNIYLKNNVEDNCIIKISPQGAVLLEKSFSEILIDNGLRSLLLGQFGFTFNSDPIHINQVTPALANSPYWDKGDLLISARHLSTIFIYRPSNNKIIWYKLGPWLNQHSPQFVNNHLISVFDNNVVSGVPLDNAYIKNNQYNRALIYDFSKKSISEPFKDSFNKARINTITAGRLKLISDNYAFVEETENGRYIGLSNNQIIWEYINKVGSNKVGASSWSRYLKNDYIDSILPNL